MSQSPTPSTQPTFAIEKLFVKDLSIEVPNAPKIFLERETPQIEIQLNNNAGPIDNGYFEATLNATVTAKLGERIVFLVEVSQGGVFQIRNVPEADMQMVLGVTCPNILFPYLREVVSQSVVRAGFAPVILNPVNFEAIYQAQKQAKDQPTGATH
jgi:preprotein translocase subunit SecB